MTPDADAATIKRAYASKLRETRPDDDPEGFQRLHEAYRLALRHRQSSVETVPTPMQPPEASHAPTPAPTQNAIAPAAVSPSIDADDETPIAPPAPQPPMFDPTALSREVVAHACDDDAEAFRRWLQQCEAFWSLRVKQAVGVTAMRALYRSEPPMPQANQDVFLEFFDLNTAQAGHDPLALSRLRQRMQIAWEMQPEHAPQLTDRLYRQSTTAKRREKVSAIVHSAIESLRRPFRRSSLLLQALRPYRCSAMRDFILGTSGGDPENMPTDIDRRPLKFWLDAGHRYRVSAARLQVFAARSVLAMTIALLVYGVGVLLNQPAFGFDPAVRHVGKLVVVCTTVLIALPWFWLAWQGLDQWQIQPEPLPVQWPWLCLIFIPLLSMAGVALSLLGVAAFGLPLLALACILALRRFLVRRRGGRAISTYWIRVAIWIIAVNYAARLASLHLLPILAPAAALIACTLWGVDLWQHRYALRVRNAA
ncbi:hypothetical protein LF63_0106660 [Oleiagrimonas soli]|uniref:J domain-containing protein n=1 Tax=Oleiagrimonas soli TaxID=1543381 RepID=A0A099CWQ0_9GAMM|nr:hypothetical protein LF63_0106660 [Oleiagrimonas soli]